MSKKPEISLVRYVDGEEVEVPLDAEDDILWVNFSFGKDRITVIIDRDDGVLVTSNRDDVPVVASGVNDNAYLILKTRKKNRY